MYLVDFQICLYLKTRSHHHLRTAPHPQPWWWDAILNSTFWFTFYQILTNTSCVPICVYISLYWTTTRFFTCNSGLRLSYSVKKLEWKSDADPEHILYFCHCHHCRSFFPVPLMNLSPRTLLGRFPSLARDSSSRLSSPLQYRPCCSSHGRFVNRFTVSADFS